jgi:hypothetical protein
MRAVSTECREIAVVTVFGGLLMFTAGLGTAGAEPVPPPPAPPPPPDGLVTVARSGTTVLDSVSTAEAAGLVTQLCGAAVPDPVGLVQLVDTQGVSQVACTGTPAGEVVVTQNVGSSPVVPGTEGTVDPSGEPAAPVPSGSEDSADDDTGVGAGEPPEVPEEAGDPEPNNPGYN